MIRKKKINIKESFNNKISSVKILKNDLEDKLNEVLPRNRFDIVSFDSYKDDENNDAIEITGISKSNRGNRDEEIFSILT